MGCRSFESNGVRHKVLAQLLDRSRPKSLLGLSRQTRTCCGSRHDSPPDDRCLVGQYREPTTSDQHGRRPSDLPSLASEPIGYGSSRRAASPSQRWRPERTPLDDYLDRARVMLCVVHCATNADLKSTDGPGRRCTARPVRTLCFMRLTTHRHSSRLPRSAKRNI